VTLLPAFLGFTGHKINSLRLPRRTSRRHGADGVPSRERRTPAERWAGVVQRKPLVAAILAGAGLLVLAAAALSMRLSLPDASVQPHDRSSYVSHKIISEGFGPGYGAPLVLATEVDSKHADLRPVVEAVRETEGIAYVTQPRVSKDGQAATVMAFPKTGYQEEATADLVHTLRDDVLPKAPGGEEVYVGGPNAGTIDFAEEVGSRLPLMIAVVIVMSLVLLIALVRSVTIALQAAVMNLLSIGAAYGVLVAIVQWGWFGSALGGRSSWADGTAVCSAPPLREEVVRPQRTIKGKESTHSSPLSTYNAPRGLRQDRGRAAESPTRPESTEMGIAKCVLLSTYDSRGGVEPLVALAVRLRELGAEVRACAPPDCAERLAEVGVPLVPVGPPVRPLVHGATPPSAADVPRIAAELIATQFDKLAAAAEGCDALVASGLTPAAASAHHPPQPLPGRPLPPDVTDNRVLNDLDVQSYNTLFGEALNTHRASIGLPPGDNVRDHMLTDHPWLAADPTLAPWQVPADLDVVQTGAWILPDERPLPAELEAFLDAGTPPVYVGFGSMRAPENIARVAIEAIRLQGRRALVGRGWANLAPIDDRDDCFVVGEVDQQALFGRVAAVVHHGGAGTTTTATRAGAPQVVVPQMGDQPYWAGRVADLGIGTAHDGPTPTIESLSAALRTALTPETRARASAVAGTIGTDGATVAAKLLLDAVSREGQPMST
jgi:vancomycin aglycone glucosyltransferase